MTFLRSYLLVSFLGVLTGCQPDQIEVYDAPKEVTQNPLSSPRASSQPDTPVAAGFTWKAPHEWKTKPANGMRIGSFLYMASGGQSVDISLVALTGDAGGELSNVNRWRGQLQLPPVSDAALRESTTVLKANGQTIRVVEFVSERALLEDRFKQRIVAATLPRGDQTLFVKMVGEDQAVREAKPSFMRFLKTIEASIHD